jgi:hypothetical protein
MATNNIKPFATESGANVYSDNELASMTELQTGFKPRSIADSKLVGKLVQDAVAGAYAVGEFTAKHGSNNVSGSNATQFATSFESALESFIEEKAPTADLSSYAPLASPAFTGTATLNGQNLATESTLGSYATTEVVEAEFESYDKTIKAHIEAEVANYLPLSGGTLTGNLTVPTVTGNLTGTADKATSDASGNVITTTYATKTEVTSGLSQKADSSTLSNYAALAGAAFTGAITVQEPTAGTNPATKNYVDSAVSSVYRYKGSVANQAALPQSDQVVGDVYNVEDTGHNFAWDGSKWDQLAGTVDLSGYLTTATAASTYATKTELSAKADNSALSNYLTISAAASTYQPVGNYATTSALNSGLAAKVDTTTYTSEKATFALKSEIPSLAPYITAETANATFQSKGSYLTTAGGTLTGNLTAPTFIGNLTGTASEATHAASADTATSATSATSATTATSAGKLTTPVTIGISGAVTGTATSFDGSANITINATAATDSSKIALSGSRGKLAGYETVTSTGAVAINDSSGDDIVASGAVTVAALSSGTQCWTKTVLLTAASPTVTLGSGWSWVGSDSAPTFSQNGMLVLARRGNKGIANFLSAGA